MVDAEVTSRTSRASGLRTCMRDRSPEVRAARADRDDLPVQDHRAPVTAGVIEFELTELRPFAALSVLFAGQPPI